MNHINAGISIDIYFHMYKKQFYHGLKMSVQIILNFARPMLTLSWPFETPGKPITVQHAERAQGLLQSSHLLFGFLCRSIHAAEVWVLGTAKRDKDLYFILYT